MNHLSSSSKRPTSWANAITLTAKSDPRRRFTDDSAVTVLRPSILVVDDDLSVARMLRDALDTWGYDVFLAHNGREGLHVLAGQIVDGILLDIRMPVMDGPTMLDEIRWLGYQMPVVVMSGDLNGPALRQLVKEDAQGFAIKPFSLPSLEKLCATVFENHGVDVPSGDHSHVT